MDYALKLEYEKEKVSYNQSDGYKSLRKEKLKRLIESLWYNANITTR